MSGKKVTRAMTRILQKTALTRAGILVSLRDSFNLLRGKLSASKMPTKIMVTGTITGRAGLSTKNSLPSLAAKMGLRKSIFLMVVKARETFVTLKKIQPMHTV